MKPTSSLSYCAAASVPHRTSTPTVSQSQRLSTRNANLKTRVWWLAYEPGERFSYSWYEVTGPNGQNVPYRGFIMGTPPSSAPLDEFSVLLHHRQFIGTVDPDLRGWLTSDPEDIFFDFDLSKPGTYEVQWGYDARFEGGPWTGERVVLLPSVQNILSGYLL